MNSADVVRKSGLTYRQLDHACRQEWLKPDNPHGKGTDNGREFNDREFQTAALAKRLMTAGFKTARAFQIARYITNKNVSLDHALGVGIGKGIALRIAPK